MANERQNGPTPVEKAETLLKSLKSQAEDAHKAGDVFTLTLMQELIRVTSPIVTRAVNRFHREERARINEMARKLREQNREQKPVNRET